MDPQNRLVAAELERRWNTALAAHSQLESELHALQRERPEALSSPKKTELLQLAQDIPALWNHPQSSPEHKKRILRAVVREIVVTCENNIIRLALHWQGGDHTEIKLPKNRTGQHRFITDSNVIEIVRDLARIETDPRIASILNKADYKTAHGQIWTAMLVCSLRHRHSIEVFREGEREERAEVFVGEAATILGVTPTSVLRLIRLKQLAARQVCANAPWILRKSDVEKLAADRALHAPRHHTDSNQMTLEIQ